MTDKERKAELFDTFKAGRTSNIKLSIKDAFDQFLEKFDWYLFMSEHFVLDHEHRETCGMLHKHYYPVGDIEHGCTCTGKLHRYLTTKEIYDLVLLIPDERIALHGKNTYLGKDENNMHQYKTNDAYHIMQHIADFRGETLGNCKEDKHCTGAFLERVMHFKGIGTYPCGYTFKFVEEGNDPKFQQATQKERVLALLKRMMKNKK